MKFLEAWVQGGPPALVEPRSRLFILPPSSLEGSTAGQGRDVKITAKGRPLRPGDWFLILSNGKTARIRCFGRVNRRNSADGRPQAFSSLFWHFVQDGPILGHALRPSSLLRKRFAHGATIRRIATWLSGRYRTGSIEA